MNTFWLIPNVIGYFRGLLLIIFILTCTSNVFYIYSHSKLTIRLIGIIAYIVSYSLDAVDGPVARSLGQCSRFGSLLDMCLDRASSASLILVASRQSTSHGMYNGWIATLGALCMALDIVSHYACMYVTSQLGLSSHKDIAKQGNEKSDKQGNDRQSLVSRLSLLLLCMYYGGARMFMLSLCIGNEAFWLLRLILSEYSHSTAYRETMLNTGIFSFIHSLVVGLMVMKQLVHVIQLVFACRLLANLDDQERADRIKHKKHT